MSAINNLYKISFILLLLVVIFNLFKFAKESISRQSEKAISTQSQEILDSLIEPLCDPNKEIDDSNISNFFTQNYIDFHNSRQTVGTPKDVETAKRDNISAISVARYDLERLFGWSSANTCDQYLNTIDTISLNSIPTQEGIDATHSFEYSYLNELNVRLKLKATPEGWRIDSIGTEGFGQINKYDFTWVNRAFIFALVVFTGLGIRRWFFTKQK